MIANNHLDIIRNLGKALSLDLEFDRHGICTLLFNGHTEVQIRSFPDDGTITVCAEVCPELPDPISYGVVEDLFALALDSLNYSGNSPVLGRNPETDTVILYEIFTASVLAKHPLHNLIATFVATVLAIRRLLEENPSNPEPESIPAAAQLMV